ncbi:DUF397 domain-containing protein [Umezawaea sp. Da 62-37]|uniref:DUF397 domain-containing protein n=1 Tax=Umezawaea sp. Da 62-37 TaxID=3075927 RepID=UPI0028F6E6D3|nr:DUF397 domain-containing protein [Umezawaea sp. Da 62-37]WNV90625.1 DUF397 domain-containing protein [Umezawaea sp. Da 62-37]
MGKTKLSLTSWRKSSFSGGNSGCVEVAFGQWHRSSHSGGNSNCVEVARASDVVGIRDSKNPEAGHLTVPRAAWAAFVATVD